MHDEGVVAQRQEQQEGVGPAFGLLGPRTHHVLALEFGSKVQFDDSRLEWRRLFSELLGTFMLVLVAAGGGILHGEGQISLAAAVVAPGLMVMAIILFMGAVSGAHLNPVVSLAFALRRDFPWKRLPGYVIVQLAGAALACLFLDAVFGNVQHLGATLPGPGYANWQALLMEIVLTGTLGERDPGNGLGRAERRHDRRAGRRRVHRAGRPMVGARKRHLDEPGPLVRAGAGERGLLQLLGIRAGPARGRDDRRRLRLDPARRGRRSARLRGRVGQAGRGTPKVSLVVEITGPSSVPRLPSNYRGICLLGG